MRRVLDDVVDLSAADAQRLDMYGPGVGVHDASPLAAVHGDMPAPKAGEPGYAWDTASCVVCHAKSENPGQYDHEPFFPTKPKGSGTGR